MLLLRFNIGQSIGEKTSKWNTVRIRGDRGWAFPEKGEWRITCCWTSLHLSRDARVKACSNHFKNESEAAGTVPRGNLYLYLRKLKAPVSD
jgi:hypothetical protein